MVLPDKALGSVWQNQLALLLESTGEGIFGIDMDGHCTFINRAGALMLGREPADLLGRNMHELTHHSHADGSAYPAHTTAPSSTPSARGCRAALTPRCSGTMRASRFLWSTPATR